METAEMTVMDGPVSIRGVPQSICVTSAAMQNKGNAAEFAPAVLPDFRS
jgi:phosphoribosylcarboxyaminoimidazole (NCAIR) mutase